MDLPTLDSLLATLRERGVQLWLDGPDLRYRSPEGALTPELRAELKRQKATVIGFLKTAGSPASNQLPLGRRPDDSRPLLSFAQERLWFLDQLEPNSGVYNIPLGLRLNGRLNVKALQETLDEIVRRHESLRTHFVLAEGQPRQVIAPATSFEIPLIDLSHLPEPMREAEAQRLFTEEAKRPFDLARGLMLRAKLLCLGPEVHHLLLVMHHIASDGWSIGVFVRELKTLYHAFSGGKAPTLPELPVQYADFAIWQRNWLQSEVLEEQLGYWKKQLAGAPALTELPGDRPRPAMQSYLGAILTHELPPAILSALTDLSRSEGASLFMTLLAAFQTLLYRYTGLEDVVVGSIIAGRNRPEVEALIGFFVNTLVLRGDLSGNPTFRALIGRMRETALGAYAHQDLPFEKLVEALQPERNPSHSPLFQVLLVLQNVPLETVSLPGLKATPILTDTGLSKFDLSLYVREVGQSLKVVAEYNTDLFEAETIRRLLNHFQVLLENVVKNPDQQIARLPILTRQEENQILSGWNRTASDYPRESCLPELIEQQAGRTPDALAVVFEDQRLTYQELNERANQLARHLQKLGIGPDSLVGIYVDRSLEMVIGLLGILKAGGAYVPLDPYFPKERLAFMLQDSALSVLLTQEHLVQSLPASPAQLVRLDSDWPTIAAADSSNLPRQTTSRNLAYVLYTSGSTGQPKGVQIPHQAVVNFLQSMSRQPGLTAQDKLLAITTLSFDIAGLELWLPLSLGAQVIIAKRETAQDGPALARLLDQSQATVMQATPSTWRMLLAAGWRGNRRLKILCGGEPWPKELAQDLLEKCQSLWNMYGPTETTIWSAATEIKPGEPILIGKPIANTQFYVVDRHLQPVPVGVPGELCIGGDGLARGYFNRPELTAEKFIPNPFSPESGARIYRTGDLVRYQPDGNVEFLARMDHQVKLRGFRIELGEIESVLNQHAGIQASVVMAREDAPGDKRLVAYLTSKNDPVTSAELREHLRAKLPDYMVPTAFVTLDRFPLTPNGKVDRKALPKPETEADHATFVQPSTATEIALANIWCEVLGVNQVSLHDNFFDLGGHSLLAVRVVGEINRTLQVDLRIPIFFQNPTIGQLARNLRQSSTTERKPTIHSLSGKRTGTPVFFIVPGYWEGYLENTLASQLSDRYPIFITDVPFHPKVIHAAATDPNASWLTLEEMATAHVALIRSQRSSGPCVVTGFSFGGMLAYEVARQLQQAGVRVSAVILLDTWMGRPKRWWRFRLALRKRLNHWKGRRFGYLWLRHTAKRAVIGAFGFFWFQRHIMAALKEGPGYIGRKARARFQPPVHSLPRAPLEPTPVVIGDLDNVYTELPWEILELAIYRMLKQKHIKQLATRGILFRCLDGEKMFDEFDDSHGARRLFTEGFQVVDIPGDHHNMFQKPRLTTLSQRFAECLDQIHCNPS